MEQAYIVTDLGYGDAGKGTIIDFLSERFGNGVSVVRSNGGPQAAHNVVLPDGTHHMFSQFGSGMLQGSRVKTYHTPTMLVSPTGLLFEAQKLSGVGVNSPLSRLHLSTDSPVITPYHRAVNWAREMSRGSANHGTCGHGVGEVMLDILRKKDDVIFVRDFLDPQVLREKLLSQKRRKGKQARLLLDTSSKKSPMYLDRHAAVKGVFQGSDILDGFLGDVDILMSSVPSVSFGLRIPDLSSNHLLFEGAQGVLIDEWFGFHPHTTWSTTTSANAENALLHMFGRNVAKRVGVLRAYTVRHGAGPHVTYDPSFSCRFPEKHNADGWPGSFRFGPFDAVAHRYALLVNGGVDMIALTCLDRVSDASEWKYVNGYEYCGALSRKELELLFVFDGDTIRDIRFSGKRDLRHQERLTRALFDCRPKEVLSVPIVEMVSMVTNLLNVRVGLVSYGPTFNDKKWL